MRQAGRARDLGEALGRAVVFAATQISKKIPALRSQVDQVQPYKAARAHFRQNRGLVENDAVARYVASAEVVALIKCLIWRRLSGFATRGGDEQVISAVRSCVAIHGEPLSMESSELLSQIVISATRAAFEPLVLQRENQWDPGSSLTIVMSDSIPAGHGPDLQQAARSVAPSVPAALARLANPPEGMQAAQLDAMLERYLFSLRSITDRIRPLSFDTTRTAPMSGLYVKPHLIDARGLKLPADSLIGRRDRTVVLGDPGGGKTTLARWVSLQLLGKCEVLESKSTAHVPVTVVLRDFDPSVHRSPSIVTHISHNLGAIHQVDVDREDIEWLLITGRLFVIFDGLDELVDTGRRSDVVDTILSFSTSFRDTPILVTSRRIGYEQAPLSSDFSVVHLSEFSKQQVREYAQKWFDLDDEQSAHARLQKAENFLAESEEVSDIRSNALMLALMCTIYKTDNYIPRNRPELYEKCSRMLFDKWDRHRGLLKLFDFDAHFEPALMHIAYTIYSSQELQSGITESRLEQEAEDYLKRWQYDDRQRARIAAREFIEFCRGRAWVFTDVGTAASGESFYQFTHRTFLEYFCACYLAHSAKQVNDLVKFLAPRIGRAEWDMVAQLAIQIRARVVRGGYDEVVSLLLDNALVESDFSARTNTIVFVFRALSFLPVSPHVTRRVVGVAIDLWMEAASRSGVESVVVEESLNYFGRGAIEVRGVLWADLLRSIAHRIRFAENRELEHLVAAALFLRRHIPADALREVKEMVAAVEVTAYNVLTENVNPWPWVAYFKHYANNSSAEDLLQHVRITDVLAKSEKVPGFSVLYPPPGLDAAGFLKSGYSVSVGASALERNLRIVAACSEYLRQSGPVRLPERGLQVEHVVAALDAGVPLDEEVAPGAAPDLEPLPREVAVTVAVVMAYAYEILEHLDPIAAVEWIATREVRLQRLALFSDVFAARAGQSAGRIEVLRVLDESHYLLGVGSDLLLDWADHQIDLVDNI